jgi:hypothetical protein
VTVENEFLRDTWCAWRAGLLSPMAQSFADGANKPFDAWLRDNPILQKRDLNQFWEANPPLANEFLVVAQWAGVDELVLVVTNLRIWMRQSKRATFQSVRFADLARYEVKAKLINHVATFTLKSGTVRTVTGPFPLSPEWADFLIAKSSSRDWADEIARAGVVESNLTSEPVAVDSAHRSDTLAAPDRNPPTASDGIFAGVRMLDVGLLVIIGGAAAWLVLLLVPYLSAGGANIANRDGVGAFGGVLLGMFSPILPFVAIAAILHVVVRARRTSRPEVLLYVALAIALVLLVPLASGVLPRLGEEHGWIGLEESPRGAALLFVLFGAGIIYTVFDTAKRPPKA